MKKSEADDPQALRVAREIHHRVKNNLQVIASILRMQIRREDSPSAQTALADAIHRIMGMVQVHELLAHSESDALDLKELLDRILDLNVQTLLLPGQEIRRKVEGPVVMIDPDRAVSVALAVNELVINSLKHAFRGGGKGTIGVAIRREGDGLDVDVWDDGPGLPKDFQLRSSSQLGLDLVRSIVQDDLKGALEVVSGKGARFRMRFPVSS